ncbi:MAG: YfhO family protein [Lachnospiraceae bacterium]|nr:YfhO family protein [Lachnospiraceae bacterium]
MRKKLSSFIGYRKKAFLAAILSGIMAVLIFTCSGILFGGSHIFLHDDLWASYPPFYKLYFNTLFSSGFTGYSFYQGMGAGIGPGAILGCILCPFNWIAVVIRDYNVAYAVITIGKLMLASYFFARLAKEVLRKESMISVAFSVSYSLCGYVLIFYYNVHFLEGLYMLPLLVRLLHVLITQGKYKKMVWALAYLFITAFYEGYMIGVFLALMVVAGSALFYTKTDNDGFKNRLHFTFSRTGELFLSAVLAALIAFVVLFPTAYSIFHSMEVASGNEITAPILQSESVIKDFLGAFTFWQGQNQDSNLPAVYSGLITVIMAIVFFAVPNKNGKQKIFVGILFAFLLICTFIPRGYVAIHLFDMPDGSLYRFSYFYSFLFCLCGLEGTYVLLQNKKWRVIGLIVPALVLMETIYGGTVLEKAQDRGDYENVALYSTWKEEVEELTESVMAADQGLYRFHYENNLQGNDAMYFGYPSVTYFTNVMNENVRRANEALGYASSPKNLFDQGGTPVTRMLYGQKYTILNGKDAVNGDAVVSINDYALPLVYTANDAIRDFAFDGQNAFENQNGVLSALTGEKCQVFTVVNDAFYPTYMNTRLGMMEEGYYFELEDPSLGSGVLYFDVETDEDVYAQIKQPERYIINVAPKVFGEQGFGKLAYTELYAGAVTRLMETEEGSKRLSILIHEDTMSYGTFDDIVFYAYHPEVLQEAYTKLYPGQLEHPVYKNKVITGDMNVPEGQTTLVSFIPYEAGWHVYIDGVEVKTFPILEGAFLGAGITPGAHEVKMVYKDPMGMYCLLVSFICTIVFAAVCITTGKKRHCEG